MKWIVDIHGEIEGDYELICKYDERPKGERKTGKWDELPPTDAWKYICDQCGRRSDFKENYCPNCGARMEN